MSKRIDFILSFPDFDEKDGKYYLYQGILHGFDARELLVVAPTCLDQCLLKRKIFLAKIMLTTSSWTREENDSLFLKVFHFKDNLASYFKKESASLVLMALFPNASESNQKKLINDLSQSRYKNNRRRIYKHFHKNWSQACIPVIEKAWEDFRDEEIVGLAVSKMPQKFILQNFEEINEYLNDDSSRFDFFRRLIRNKLYARLYKHVPTIIADLKDNDPISFLFILKENKIKPEIDWAVKLYKEMPRSRFLARWYSDMKLWPEILRQHPNFKAEVGI